jgi:antitoxin FitA
MASIVIRNIEESLKDRLRIRAAKNGRSMEEEARTILREAIPSSRPVTNLADLANELFGGQGIELDRHPETAVRPKVNFD